MKVNFLFHFDPHVGIFFFCLAVHHEEEDQENGGIAFVSSGCCRQAAQSVRQGGEKNALAHPQRRKIRDGRGRGGVSVTSSSGGG